LIGFVMYFRATYESIGIFGVALAVLFFGAIVWLLLDIGWLDPDEPQTFVWVVLIVLATIMAIGMSWSILRRRLTGQVDQV
jgi:energy-converting hydrogenase Eha subunit A